MATVLCVKDNLLLVAPRFSASRTTCFLFLELISVKNATETSLDAIIFQKAPSHISTMVLASISSSDSLLVANYHFYYHYAERDVTHVTFCHLQLYKTALLLCLIGLFYSELKHILHLHCCVIIND